MKTRIGSYQALSAWLLLLGLFLFAFCSCDLPFAFQDEETNGTEEASSLADVTTDVPEGSSAEEVTRIPVTTKDQSTTESQPDSSNTTESPPSPTPPAPDTDDTAADEGIGEVLPWDGEDGLQ